MLGIFQKESWVSSQGVRCWLNDSCTTCFYMDQHWFRLTNFFILVKGATGSYGYDLKFSDALKWLFSWTLLVLLALANLHKTLLMMRCQPGNKQLLELMLTKVRAALYSHKVSISWHSVEYPGIIWSGMCKIYLRVQYDPYICRKWN